MLLITIEPLKKEVAVEYLTKKQLIQEFITANVFYISTKENVETILISFIIGGTIEERILTKTESYLEGFFLLLIIKLYLILNWPTLKNLLLKN